MRESQSPALQAPSPKSRRYPEDFKRDAVRLVTDEQYTVKAAAQAVGVSEKSLYDWHKKFTPPPVPCGDCHMPEITEAFGQKGQRPVMQYFLVSEGL